MTTPLPATSRNYFTRANMPFGANNTTQVLIESYYLWLMQAVLRDIFTPGSTGGTRHANSIWICRGSSNAVAGGAVSGVGVAGTDRWGGAVFPANFVRGNNSTAHHWMLLENVALGYELLLNFSTNDAYMTFSIGKSGCFTGGSVSACPVPTTTQTCTQAGQAGYNTSDNGQVSFFGDTTNFGNTMYAHFTCADTGEFHFGMSRVGLGTLFNWVGIWASQGYQVGDTNAMFVLSGDTTTTGRGAMNAARIATSAFCASRQPNGNQKSNGGIAVAFTASTNIFNAQTVDAINAQYKAAALTVLDLSPQYVSRGSLIDMYIMSEGPVAASIPTAAAQERVLFGNLIAPMKSVAPLV